MGRSKHRSFAFNIEFIDIEEEYDRVTVIQEIQNQRGTR